MRRLLLVPACLLWAAAAEAQVYRFRTYTSGTGLPNNAVYAVFQDRDGYIWFATDGGACRYDGVDYMVLSAREGLVDASVRSLVEDRQGGLWILTKGGLSRFHEGRFTNYTTAQGLVDNEVRCGVRTQDGALWFGTSAGLSRFDGRSFRSYTAADGLPRGHVWTLLEDRSGTLWVGVRRGGLARFDGERFTAYGPEQGLKDPNIFDMTEDPKGGMWIATDGGLVRFDGTRFRHYTVADGLPSDRVSSVLVDRHGRVWCGTFGGGIARFHDGRVAVFDRKNGLPDNYVTGLLKDREDNIWCSTLWSGAFRFASERFANYTSTSGIGSGLVTGLAETPDGTLWLSSINEGLSALDARGVVRRYGVEDGLLEEGLWAVFADSRGRVWTGGLKGVSVLDGKRFRSFTLKELGALDRINAIIEDRAGRLWFGSGAAGSTGIVVYDGQRFAHYSTKEGLAHNQINGFATDSEGRVWVATEDGLSRFDGERFTTYRMKDGLPSKRVICAHEDKPGQLWVGTSYGLCRFDGRGFKTYGAQDGLASNVVQAITSRDGVVWVGTSHGLSAFDGQRFRSYTEEDGLISHQFGTGAALRRRDRSLWFGTAEGAVRYRPFQETTLDLPPLVHVTGIRTRGQLLPVASKLVLPRSENSLSFEFLGLSFTNEDAVRHSTLLEGFDADWSEPARPRSIRFTNLPPGRYVFRVKARSAAGLWSEPVAAAVEIRPAFWATWWFRLLVLAAMAGLGYATLGARLRRVENRQQRRAEGVSQLLEAIRAIHSRLELDTLLQDIAVEGARLAGGEPGGTGLLEGDLLVFRRVWTKEGWVSYERAVHRGEGVAGQVAATGRSAIVNDPGTAAGQPPPTAVGSPTAGLMDVPILDRSGEVVGVVEVLRRPGGPPFGEAERQLVEALAAQAAVAIENARRHGAARRPAH